MSYVVKIELKDGSKHSVRKIFRLRPSIVTEADAVTAKDAIRDAVAGISVMSLVKTSLIREETQSYVSNVALKSDKAGIVASSVSGKTYPFLLPAPDDAVFGAAGTPAYDIVNGAAPEVVAYLDAISNYVAYSDGETGVLSFVSGKRIE